MNDYYIESIKKKKMEHNDLYEEVILEYFGGKLTWDDFKKSDIEIQRKVLLSLSNKIKLKESKIDVNKLTYAIQNSKSGYGFCAMTSFRCSFCDKDEVWSNTNVPNICKECSRQLAENIAMNFSDIFKYENKEVLKEETSYDKSVEELDDKSIEELDFSVRTYNILKRAGINTLTQLLDKTEEELLNLRHSNKKVLREIRETIRTPK